MTKSIWIYELSKYIKQPALQHHVRENKKENILNSRMIEPPFTWWFDSVIVLTFTKQHYTVIHELHLICLIQHKVNYKHVFILFGYLLLAVETISCHSLSIKLSIASCFDTRSLSLSVLSMLLLSILLELPSHTSPNDIREE